MAQSPALLNWRTVFHKIKAQQFQIQYSHVDISTVYLKVALADLYASLPPLQSANGEIRLLQLQPGKRSDPIECSITTACLQDHPEYEALSYTWSRTDQPENHPTSPVHINGILIYTLPNLSIALSELRDELSTRIFWIDYLCINQAYADERNGQIKQMAEIYSSASQVVLFLGQADSSTPSALDTLQRLSRGSHLPDVFRDSNFQEITQKCTALAGFFGSPWWSRIWTIQESVLARDAVLVCGSHTVPWHHIALAGDQVTTHLHCCERWMYEHPSFGEVWEKLSSASARCVDSNQLEQYKLSDLLTRYNGYKATDPRDHVFSLLGMLREEERIAAVDYSFNTLTIYMQTALAIIRHEQSVKYLASMFSGGQHPYRSPRKALPSWVPDIEHCTLNRYIIRTYDLFSAAGSTQLSLRVVNDSRIALKGVFVDVVSTIATRAGQLARTRVRSQSYAKALHEHLTVLEAMVEQYLQRESDDEATTAARLAAFYRTVAMGAIEGAAMRTKRLAVSDLHTTRVPPSQYSTYVDARNLIRDYASMPADTPIYTFFAKLEEAGFSAYGFTVASNQAQSMFFITHAGRLAMGDRGIRRGDRVVIFKGGRVPFLVRRRVDRKKTGERAGGDEMYEVIGVAYVDGIMDGEAVDGVGEEEWKDIHLV